MADFKDPIPESMDYSESDSNVSDYPESHIQVPRLTSHDLRSLNTERKLAKHDLLLESRLSESRHRNELHGRATKLKHHFREVESCNKIMAYGFVVIMFLLTGFYWFIMLFAAEVKETFNSSHVVAPAFIYGTLILGGLNFII